MDLSPTQIAHYHEHGYVLLGSILDAAALAAMRDEEARFRARPMANDQDRPGQRTLFRSQLCDYSVPVRELSTRGAHLDAVRNLLGPDLLFMYNQFVTKLPDGDSGGSIFPWHQDLGYLAIEPATTVTIWTALDDVDEENGCIWVHPGSQRRGLLPHQKRSQDSWFLDVAVEGDGVPARLKAGEAVLFSGLTLHRSLSNRSNRPRRAFFMEYAEARAIEVHSGKSLVESPRSWLVSGQLPVSAASAAAQA